MSGGRKAALRRCVLALALHEDSDYWPLHCALSAVHDQADRYVLLAVYTAACVLNEAEGGYEGVEIAEADVLYADEALDESVSNLRCLVSELPQACARVPAGDADSARQALRCMERIAAEVRIIRKIYDALTTEDAAKAARWHGIAIASGARPGGLRAPSGVPQ